MTTFDELGLSQKVLSAVADAGYTVPTPIQAGAIPPALERRDVLGIAQTGTGKTASFVLPMLTLLEKGRARARMPRTLILEPTRELAAQVAENFEKYGKNHRLTVALLIGGVSFAEQNKKLERGADVLIATPGRLLDHVERGKLLMNGVDLLVIDEADRMLDMGFIPDIERIVKMIPFTRQTLFFSATMPPEITRLSEQFLQNAVRVEVAPPSTTALNVTQNLVACGGGKDFEKRAVLRDLVRSQDKLTNAIIFCNRKKDIGELSRSLQRHGFSVGALHGDMDQRSRMATLQQFKDNEITLLVASDVAARGLDIPAVSHVFNYDVPIHAEDYVHRIGRTGRAGRSGAAFSLTAKRDGKYVDAIEKLINRKIEWLEGVEISAESASEEETTKPARRSSRGQSRKTDEGTSKGRTSSSRAKSKADEDAAIETPAELAADANFDPVPQGEPTKAPRAARQSRRAAAKPAVQEVAQQDVVVVVETPAELASNSNTEARPENTRDQNTRDQNTRDQSGRDRGGRGNNRSSGNQSSDRPNAANDDRHRGRKNRNSNDDAPVGFGDDIPAFMMISAKL